MHIEEAEIVERFREQLDDWGGYWGGPFRHAKPEAFLMIVLGPLYRAYPAAADAIRDVADSLDDLLTFTRGELLTIERYSHVMHLVSHVEGALAPGRSAWEVLQAVFPHGTVSGAPKVRAMEIIDALEPVARGPYAGCVGYFGFDGSLNTAITIRTVLVRHGTAYVQAGAGVVYDSVPEREQEECVAKARALMAAIERAGRTGGRP